MSPFITNSTSGHEKHLLKSQISAYGLQTNLFYQKAFEIASIIFYSRDISAFILPGIFLFFLFLFIHGLQRLINLFLYLIL